VHDQELASIRCHVHGLALDLDAAEMHAAIVAHAFVVIARDVDDASAFTHLAQQLLQHVVVSLGPDRPAPDAPEIQNVADEINRLGVVVFQKIEEEVGL
jgi:hypothetical protein